MKAIKEFKEILKTWAKEIRELKAQRKKRLNGYVPGLDNLRYKYRLNHIAYCELRGTPREKIERKTHNPPYEPAIEKIKKEWVEKMEVQNENVCGSEG